MEYEVDIKVRRLFSYADANAVEDAVEEAFGGPDEPFYMGSEGGPISLGLYSLRGKARDGESGEQLAERLAHVIWDAAGYYVDVEMSVVRVVDIPTETYMFKDYEYARYQGQKKQEKEDVQQI